MLTSLSAKQSFSKIPECWTRIDFELSTIQSRKHWSEHKFHCEPTTFPRNLNSRLHVIFLLCFSIQDASLWHPVGDGGFRFAEHDWSRAFGRATRKRCERSRGSRDRGDLLPSDHGRRLPPVARYFCIMRLKYYVPIETQIAFDRTGNR